MKTWLMLAAGVLVAGTAWAAADKNAKTGKIKVTSPGVVIRLKTPEDRTYGGAKVMKSQGEYDGIPLPVDKEVPMPEGKYEINSITATQQAKDDNGAPVVWSMTAEKDLGKLKDVTVKADETVVLEAGGPFKVKVDLKFLPENNNDPHVKVRTEHPGQSVLIKVRYVGKGGEEYVPRLWKGRTLSATNPQVRIWDEAGNMIHSVAYDLALDKPNPSYLNPRPGFGGASWRRPPNLQGKFRIEVVPYAGPFEFEKQPEDDWKEFPDPKK